MVKSRITASFTWAIIAIAWLASRLSILTVFSLGPMIGGIAYKVSRKRRRIAEINVDLCFPHYNAKEKQQLLKDIFKNLGASAIETAFTWLNPAKNFSRHFTLKGLDILQEAQRKDQGVLVLGAHFSVMDILSQPITKETNIDVVYRKNKNPRWEFIQRKGRKNFHKGPNVLIERGEIRTIVRRLKMGRTVWYAADQDFGAKHSVFAPFFGISSATAKSPFVLAKLTGCSVLFLTATRNWQHKRWTLEFSAPFDNWPGEEDIDNAAKFNATIQHAITKNPAQYLWVHRRFKTTPPGLKNRYSSL